MFEERVVALVLLLAGALGIAIGGAAPRANATELVLGLGFAGLGAWTLRRSRVKERP